MSTFQEDLFRNQRFQIKRRDLKASFVERLSISVSQDEKKKGWRSVDESAVKAAVEAIKQKTPRNWITDEM